MARCLSIHLSQDRVLSKWFSSTKNLYENPLGYPEEVSSAVHMGYEKFVNFLKTTRRVIVMKTRE